MNFKKVIGWVAFALVLVGIIGTNIYQHREQKTDKPTVKIGAILPLTGAMGFVGQTNKDLYEMRLSEIPENSKFKYQLIFEDDQLDAQKSLTAGQKLISLDNVDVLLASGSGPEPAIADIAAKNKKIMFSLLLNEEAPLKTKYAFNMLLLPSEYVHFLTKELNKRGLKNVGVFIENSKGQLTTFKNFRESLKGTDIQIVGEEYVAANEKDFRISIYKMAQKEPDIYVCFLLPSTMQGWIREYKRQELTQPVTSVNGFDFVEDKTPFEGVWYVSDSIINNEMEQKYKERYGKDLLMSQALWGYEALNAVINAYESFDTKPTADQLVEKLYEKRTNTVVGDVQYKGNGILHGNGIMKIIKNGKAVKLDESEEK